MSKRSRRRKNKSLSKKEIIFIIKIGTIVGAVLIAVLLGVFIPRSMDKSTSTIEMSKEYEPGEEISTSLQQNEEVEDLIDDETPEDTITISKQETEEDLDIEEVVEEPVEDVEEVIEEEAVDETTEPIDETNAEEVTTETTPTETVDEDVSTEPTPSETEEVVPTDTVEETPEVIIEETPEETPEVIIEETPEETEEVVDESDDEVQYVKDEWVDDLIQENEGSIDNNDLVTGAAIYNKLDTGYLFGLSEGGMTDEEKAEAKEYLEANLTAEEYALAITLFNKYIGLAN